MGCRLMHESMRDCKLLVKASWALIPLELLCQLRCWGGMLLMVD